MLSNAYFLVKFRFDTAGNEPAKNLQNFAKFANFADPNPLTLAALRDLPQARSFPVSILAAAKAARQARISARRLEPKELRYFAIVNHVKQLTSTYSLP